MKITVEFRQLSHCWYGDACLRIHDYKDEVLVNIRRGDRTSEIAVRWYGLSGDPQHAARLEAFGDSWWALATREGKDLVALLADLKYVKPDEFSLFLSNDLGWKDVTPEREGE